MKNLFLSMLMLLSVCREPLHAQNPQWRYLGDTLLSSWNTAAVLTAIHQSAPFLAIQGYDTQGSTFWDLKRWNGSAWQPLDTNGLGSNNYLAWGFAANGAPRLAYYNNDSKAIGIKQLANNTWNTITESPQIAGQPYMVQMVFDQQQLFVAYSDLDQEGRVYVWAFNGANWQSLTTTGISNGNVYPLVLASDNGVPWVAFREIDQGYAGIVKKFNGANWEQVGNVAFDGNVHGGMDFAVAGNKPYLIHSDSGTQQHARVLTLTGSEWTPLGSPLIVPASYFLKIALDKQNGTPYFLFDDSGPNFWGLSAMRYNGADWEFVGERGFIGNYWSVKLLLDNGTPYIGYQNGPFGQPASVQVFSQTSRIPETPGKLDQVRLFPNPVTTQVMQLQTRAKEDLSCIAQVLDQQGRIITSFALALTAGENVHALSLPKLAPGIYHLQILSGPGRQPFHQRFLVLE